MVKDKLYEYMFYSIKCLVAFSMVILLNSCESLVEVDTPSTTFMDRKTVFADEATAELAVIGMYGQMRGSSHPFYADSDGLSDLLGLNSDELFYTADDIIRNQFQENSLLADNSIVENIWRGLYESIYTANMLVENLESSEALSVELSEDLRGEALFVRAFCYFYLLNLYGDVPLVTTSDYQRNANIPRSPIADVYDQIEADLIKARELLPEYYPDGERVRANKMVASALLSRVHLYRENWEEAENIATTVITNVNHDLVDLNSIVLANNNEAIWQFSPSSQTENPVTPEGINFGSATSVNVLQSDFINVFESEDQRQVEWVRENSIMLPVPDKYKVSASGGGRSEYSTVFRLAEQYLIRAEARVKQNKLSGAISDIDVIRARAGLPLIADTNPGIGQADLLNAIMRERRVELFSEWGHRWLDLKRTGRAASTLNALKPGFSSDDELWPIPQLEINNNPALRGHQNPGY